MRLIDKKELKEWIENWATMNKYYHPYSKSNNIPINELYDILEQMPAIDVIDDEPKVEVEPIRHGHWVEVEIPHTLPYELNVYKCSECTHLTYDNRFTLAGRYRYCPNCGTRMDEEVEKDE